MYSITRKTSLLLLLPAVSGAQVDTSEWLCESCPFETGYRAGYEAGATLVSDEDARSGNATGYDSDGAYVNLDGAGNYVSDGYQLNWNVEDLGLDSRNLTIDGGRQGIYGFYAAFRELPYRRFDSTRTIFSTGPNNSLVLPSTWIPAGTTSAFSTLGASLQKQNIESDRQTAELGGHWVPNGAWQLFADYRHQTRDGIDITSGAGFTQASMLPRRIDFETNQVDLGIRYSLQHGNVSLAYYGSFFQNKNTALVWQTPFTAVPGATQLAMAQEPDNNFQQLSLSGNYQLDVWSTLVAVSAAVGRGEQDDSLLPYTGNPNITVASLPRNSLNGEVDTRNYALTVTSRPTSWARLKVSYRHDERDNTTAIDEWSRVITDLFPSGEVEQNVPYGFERSRLKLSANIRVMQGLRIAAGYDRSEIDRDYQEVAEQTEDSGWGQIRWRPSGWLDLRLRGGASKRDIDRYDETIATSLGQNPVLRKYNLAYRYREFAELTASIAFNNLPISLGGSLFVTDDSYTLSRLGIKSGDESRYTADINWAVTDNFSAFLMVGNESIDADQIGSAQSGEPDWRASHDDRFDNINVGFRWHEPDGKLDLRFDYSRGDGDTKILVSSENGDSTLPKLSSTLDSLRVETAYRWSDKLDVTLELRYESFSTDDWALQNVAPDTLPTILTLGATPYDYDIWALGIGLRYFFGNRSVVLIN